MDWEQTNSRIREIYFGEGQIDNVVVTAMYVRCALGFRHMFDLGQTSVCISRHSQHTHVRAYAIAVPEPKSAQLFGAGPRGCPSLIGAADRIVRRSSADATRLSQSCSPKDWQARRGDMLRAAVSSCIASLAAMDVSVFCWLEVVQYMPGAEGYLPLRSLCNFPAIALSLGYLPQQSVCGS